MPCQCTRAPNIGILTAMWTRSGRVKRQWPRNVALAALAVAVIALVAFTLSPRSVSAAQLAANSRADAHLRMTPPTETALPHVAFLGDSYTSGSPMNISGTASLHSTLLASQFHFIVDNSVSVAPGS